MTSSNPHPEEYGGYHADTNRISNASGEGVWRW